MQLSLSEGEATAESVTAVSGVKGVHALFELTLTRITAQLLAFNAGSDSS